MTKAIPILSVFLLSVNLFAQDSTTAVNAPQLPLSLTPTCQELINLFQSVGNQIDQDAAAIVVASKGDSAVPALSQILSLETIPNPHPMSIDTGNGKVPFTYGKLMAITALEKIGSPKAFSVILLTADSYGISEVRASALNSVATSYHDKALKGILTPNPQVLGTLINSVDDSTYIWFLHKTIGHVASEGVLSWMGIDFGDPQYKDARTKAGGAHGEMSQSVYRKY